MNKSELKSAISFYQSERRQCQKILNHHLRIARKIVNSVSVSYWQTELENLDHLIGRFKAQLINL